MSAALKGPWALCYDGVIEDADGGTVICFPFDSYREFNQQSDFDKAKQRAITASPELLAAAVMALADCADLMATPAGDALAAAIAKATGATP